MAQKHRLRDRDRHREWEVDLVYHGLRDCVMPSLIPRKFPFRSGRCSHTTATAAEIVWFTVCEQVYVAHRSKLLARMQRQMHQLADPPDKDDDARHRILFIDVSGTEPAPAPPPCHSMRDLFQALSDALTKNCRSGCHVEVQYESAGLSPVAVTGWLLGYPVIMQLFGANQESATNCLGDRTIRLCQIMASHSTQESFAVFAFSIPSDFNEFTQPWQVLQYYQSAILLRNPSHSQPPVPAWEFTGRVSEYIESRVIL